MKQQVHCFRIEPFRWIYYRGCSLKAALSSLKEEYNIEEEQAAEIYDFDSNNIATRIWGSPPRRVRKRNQPYFRK